MNRCFRLALLVAGGAVPANAAFGTFIPNKSLTSSLVIRVPRGGGAKQDPVMTDTVRPQVDLPEEWAPGPKRALVFMDQFSDYHGGYMARMTRDVYGVACIHLLSDYMIGYFQKFHPNMDGPNLMRIPEQHQLQSWMDALPVDIIIEGIICESDSGLSDGERVAQLLHVWKQNGSNEARRNKYLMNEAVKKAGLATVQQRCCTSVQDALAFAKELGLSNDSPQSTQQKQQQKTIINSHATTTPGLLGSGRNTHLAAGSNLCIVKPIRGVASEQVYLCPDLPSVEKAFHQIYGTTVFGSPGQSHDTVLVQEFAYGTEYALDTVSRDGQHKVAALWRYDKRPANGASFVYHATELIEANESELARTVCDYAMAALDALDLKWGTTHTEVILTTDGPRLVEVNCRQHNMDFAPLTMAGIGYNVMDMLLESYLGGGPIETVHVWDDFPTLPSIRAHAAMVHLVNHASGKLVGINGEALNEIQRLESVLELKVYPSFLEMGNHISPTVDIRSDAGWVQLINDDEEAFQRDYNRILELMPTLFVTDEE